MSAVNATRENARYLPGAPLPENLSCTDDLRVAVEGAQMVVFVVPSHAMREVAHAGTLELLVGHLQHRAGHVGRQPPMAGAGHVGCSCEHDQ